MAAQKPLGSRHEPEMEKVFQDAWQVLIISLILMFLAILTVEIMWTLSDREPIDIRKPKTDTELMPDRSHCMDLHDRAFVDCMTGRLG